MPDNGRQSWIVPILGALIAAVATITSVYINGCFQHRSVAIQDSVVCRGVASPYSEQKTIASFRNLSMRTVVVYWIDQNGEPLFWFDLMPNATHEVVTYLGHNWCIIDKKSKEPVQTATISSENQEIVVR